MHKYVQTEITANNFYYNNKIIDCPAIAPCKIKITPSGMQHLRMKNKNHRRTVKETYIRYKCFVNIKEVLNHMSYYQEYKQETRKVKEKKHGQMIDVSKVVEYIAFVAIVKIAGMQNRIKIIVSKSLGQENYEFISVIPSWNSKGYTYFNNPEIT